MENLTYTVKVSSTGTTFWYWHNKLHRVNGPAIEYANGDRCWYLNGVLHREDGPAQEFANGTKCWYRHNKLHREDGPAVEYSNGMRYWYIDNLFLHGEHLERSFLGYIGKSILTRLKRCCRQSKTIIINGVKYNLVKV